MSEPDYEGLRRKRILPSIKARAVRSLPSTTVFLGAQPGAGKTRGQELVKKLYGGRILPIVGDDFRQYHPDFKRLMRDDPLAMPGITAKAAGIWTGMAVKYADDHGVSCVIEGTWRNAPTVLDEAGKAIALGRGMHAVLLAVPPALSRLGTLARFYDDLASMGVARWTPPAAHETTIANLEKNVPLIADSGLMDRLTVISRDGAVLYDGHDPPGVRHRMEPGIPPRPHATGSPAGTQRDSAPAHARGTPHARQPGSHAPARPHRARRPPLPRTRREPRHARDSGHTGTHRPGRAPGAGTRRRHHQAGRQARNQANEKARPPSVNRAPAHATCQNKPASGVHAMSWKPLKTSQSPPCESHPGAT